MLKPGLRENNVAHLDSRVDDITEINSVNMIIKTSAHIKYPV